MRCRSHSSLTALCSAALAVASTITSIADDSPTRVWPQFRGPHGLGICPDGTIPLHFGPDSNVVWSISLPRGHSSPCIWGDHLFLTSFDEGKLKAYDIDRATGKIGWERFIEPEKIERGHPNGSPATATPATDGQRVYVYFGSHGLAAYNFDGSLAWNKPLPPPVTQHGAGTSPILAGNRLVLVSDQDVDSYVLAVDTATGNTLWRTERPEFRRSFCTPLAFPLNDPTILVVPGSLSIVAYDLATGREVWRARGVPNELGPTPVTDGERIFAGGWTMGSGVSHMPPFDDILAAFDADHDGRISSREATGGPARMHFAYIDANKDGYISRDEWETISRIFDSSQNCFLAIKPGGHGDVTDTHVLWRQKRGLPYVPSPLVYRGCFYLLKNGGLATCLDASTGEIHYQEERLGALGDYFASPIAADDRLCAISQNGDAVIWKAGPALEILAINKLGETVLATPAVIGDTLYLRTEKHLYAFREPSTVR